MRRRSHPNCSKADQLIAIRTAVWVHTASGFTAMTWWAVPSSRLGFKWSHSCARCTDTVCTSITVPGPSLLRRPFWLFAAFS